MSLTLAEVAAACGGRLQGADPRALVGRVCTDSRSAAAGATAAVVREDTAAGVPSSVPLVVVGDGLEALQRLATAVRRRSGAKVVAITGSAGKTSTKDILGALLRPVARTVVTAANLNNQIGVPLTLLEVGHDTEVVVVEMAMRGPGQIRDLARIALHVARNGVALVGFGTDRGYAPTDFDAHAVTSAMQAGQNQLPKISGAQQRRQHDHRERHHDDLIQAEKDGAARQR